MVFNSRPLGKVALLALLLALLGGTIYEAGSGEPAAPLALPDTSLAASGARQLAQATLVADAEQTVMATESSQFIVQAALLAARKRASAAVRLAQADLRDEVPLRIHARAPLATPEPTPVDPPGQTRIPILMYHHEADAPRGADAVRRDLSVGPAAFAAQMDYLLLNGYHTVSLDDLVDYLVKGSRLPAKPVVLTFDDGYDDNYTQAYPILRAHGFTATFFIITDFAGSAGYMSWPQAVDMSKNGMSIQPHGRTHPDLTVVSEAEVRWQMASSKALIEEKIGQPALFFCYPSGKYNASTLAIAKAAGYRGAVTIDYGATQRASALFELQRLRIRGGDTLDQFVAKLTDAP